MTTHILLNEAAEADVQLQRVLHDAMESGRELVLHGPSDPQALSPANWARSVAGQAEQLVVCGGDGSLHGALQGLMQLEQRPPLALVPAGTGNDLARSLPLPLEPAVVLEKVLGGEVERRVIDVVRVGDRWMHNVLTVGLPAQLTEETPQPLKNTFGGLAYVAHGLSHLPDMEAFPVKVSWDGGDWSGKALVVYVGSGRYAGGGFLVCPKADPSDGQLEVTIVPELPISELAGTMGASALGDEEQLKDLVVARGPRVTIETPEVMPANADGEPIRGRRMALEVVPGALEMLVARA